MSTKTNLESNDRYLIIEALKRWRNSIVNDLNQPIGNDEYRSALKDQLKEIRDLIGKFEEGAL